MRTEAGPERAMYGKTALFVTVQQCTVRYSTTMHCSAFVSDKGTSLRQANEQKTCVKKSRFYINCVDERSGADPRVHQ